jgi:large subunit ribosomal protein L21
MPYAIIESGGKQYRVQPGDTIEVEMLAAEPGSILDLDRVLMLSQDEQVTVGQPTVAGARVIAEVQEHGRGKKIIVFKYKPKVRYRRKQGHRQSFTRLAIKEIVSG